MKTWKLIVSIIAALVAIAGIVYAIITYGDRIVAWFRKIRDALKSRFGGCFGIDCFCDEVEGAPSAGAADFAE